MLIPSIIPSALHQPENFQAIKGTKATENDENISQKSYPATNSKMVDATTIYVSKI